jgi:peptidyl-prolyl cis-trans isomerase A (cyclophilin A)
MKQLCLITLFGAGLSAPIPAKEPPAGAPPAEAGLYAILDTSLGRITAQLFEREAPRTVKNFVALANGAKPWLDPRTGALHTGPLYSNLAFHRVIPEFLIETGDPTGTGRYDCDGGEKDANVSSLKFDRPGRLALATRGRQTAGGCQFFITETDCPWLDASSAKDSYVIFGQVMDGQEIVTEIANVPRDANDKPRAPVKLVRVTITRIAPQPGQPAREAQRQVPKARRLRDLD